MYPSEYCRDYPKPGLMHCSATEACSVTSPESAHVYVHRSAHACRGSSGNSNHDTINRDFVVYFVHYDMCEKLCNAKDDCTGFEYHPSAMHCLVWLVPIIDTEPLDGANCFRVYQAPKYSWKPSQKVNCPTECGVHEHYLDQDYDCWGNDGTQYASSLCNGVPKPEPIRCEATGVCETKPGTGAPAVLYSWTIVQEALCPTACGRSSSELIPVFECRDSSGAFADPSNCDQTFEPETILCPETTACMQYFWTARDHPSCSVDCHTPAHTVHIPSDCTGSDGVTYADEFCKEQPKPAPIDCPAISCPDYKWQVKRDPCPEGCGLPEQHLLATPLCFGSNGEAFDESLCGHIPLPDLNYECPATEACSNFEWKADKYECPSECGLPSSTILPVFRCVSIVDGSVHSQEHCQQLESAETISCPATKACSEEKVFWSVQNRECPSECGHKDTYHEVLLKCKGADGLDRDPSNCNSVSKPNIGSDVYFCPATPACADYKWVIEPVECPDTCGLPANTVLNGIARCLNADHLESDDHACDHLPKPKPCYCEATVPCLSSMDSQLRSENHLLTNSSLLQDRLRIAAEEREEEDPYQHDHRAEAFGILFPSDSSLSSFSGTPLQADSELLTDSSTQDYHDTSNVGYNQKHDFEAHSGNTILKNQTIDNPIAYSSSEDADREAPSIYVNLSKIDASAQYTDELAVVMENETAFEDTRGQVGNNSADNLVRLVHYDEEIMYIGLDGYPQHPGVGSQGLEYPEILKESAHPSLEPPQAETTTDEHSSADPTSSIAFSADEKYAVANHTHEKILELDREILEELIRELQARLSQATTNTLSDDGDVARGPRAKFPDDLDASESLSTEEETDKATSLNGESFQSRSSATMDTGNALAWCTIYLLVVTNVIQ